MKKVIVAGLVIAGIMTVTGAALAVPKRPEPKLGKPPVSSDMREDFSRRHPPMSREIRNEKNRPSLPPDNRHPRVRNNERPPMSPHSRDRRPPEAIRVQPRQQGVEPKW